MGRGGRGEVKREREGEGGREKREREGRSTVKTFVSKTNIKIERVWRPLNKLSRGRQLNNGHTLEKGFKTIFFLLYLIHRQVRNN